MIELLPGVRRIEALGDSLERVPNTLQALQDAARAKGIELVIQTVGTPEEIAPAIDAAKASDAAGLNVLAMPLFYANRRITFERTAALRLPTIYQWPEMVRQGGLVAYGPSGVQIYRRQTARLLARLLRGTKPADYRLSSRPSSSWSSTSIPPRRSASPCRNRCSPVPAR